MTAPARAPESAATTEPVSLARAPRPIVPRHRLQYAALRAVIGALGRLGFRRASNLGAELGLLGYRPFRIRRDVVRKQIAAAFPEWPSDRVDWTARAAYASLGRTTVETAIMSRHDRQDILELVRPHESWRVMEEALAQGRGVLLVAGHLGNWELAGAYIAARGVDLEVVARLQENPLFDAWLTRTRERLGMHVIWDGDAVRRVPRALKRNAAVALLIDQGAQNLASTWVPFFGRFAKTPRGPAIFALRMESPVVFVAPLRTSDGRFEMVFEHVPVHPTGDRHADVDRIIADCTAVLERWVRRAPEQYFWHHRRWKHQRPDTPPELGNPL